MENVYKFMAAFIAVVLVVGGILYLFDKKAHSKTLAELHNEIAKLEGMIQETESAYSRRGIELKRLKAKNKDLQKIIQSRNEEVAALTEANFRLKDRLFKIQNADEEVIEEDGEERVKVSFSHLEDPYLIEGFTLTNPPEAEVSLSWTRDLQLYMILAKNKSGKFRIYLDSKNGDVVPSELKLSIDPSVFEDKWFEKIKLSSTVNIGKYGGLISFDKTYDVTKSLSVGPSVTFLYDGTQARTFYGARVGWYPFKR